MAVLFEQSRVLLKNENLLLRDQQELHPVCLIMRVVCLEGFIHAAEGGDLVVRQFDARMILADVKAAHNINISSKTTVTLVQDPIIISYWNYCNILLPSNCFPTIFLQPILQTMVRKIFYER